MNNTEQQNITEVDRTPARWTNEKATWWTVFGVLVVAALVMLSAWN